MPTANEILQDLKERLLITWDDSNTDQVLIGMLNRGFAYFNEITGVILEFEEDSPELELLFERCRYAWNNALDDFEQNYHSNISRLILQKAVDVYEKSLPPQNVATSELTETSVSISWSDGKWGT
jgi:hypothetical protein